MIASRTRELAPAQLSLANFMRSFRRCPRPAPFASATASAALARCAAPEGHTQRRLEVGKGIALVRDRHGPDEMRLERGLDRRLDLLDPAHDALDLPARARIEKRNPGARARGIAGRGDLGEVTVRHEAEH